jgi:hypothetical protein
VGKDRPRSSPEEGRKNLIGCLKPDHSNGGAHRMRSSISFHLNNLLANQTLMIQNHMQVAGLRAFSS